MNESFKEKFSFLNFIDEDFLDLISAGMEVDDSLGDPSLVNCIKKLFQVSNEQVWLSPDQKCNTVIKKEFEKIFNEFFDLNETAQEGPK